MPTYSASTGQETAGQAMDDRSPAAQGRRASTVVERKLDELCASLGGALSPPRPRSPGAERRLVEEIKGKTDFLRHLLAAEGECRGGERPVYLVEAKERFAVLENTFDQWARRVVAAPAVAEEEGGCSGSECSCTDSCGEAAAGDAGRVAEEVPVDVMPDKKQVADRESVEEVYQAAVPREEAASDAREKKRDAEHQTEAETKRISTVQRRWWRRSAAWCGAAGVVAVVAVGVAVELAAVARHNVGVYVVPT